MRNKIFFILCFCFLTTFAFAATTEHWYVDPDASGAGDGTSWTDAYTSLAAWNTAKTADITAATGSDKILIVHCRSSGGTDDNANFVMRDWVTSAGNYVQVQGDDFPSDGIWDEDKYLIHSFEGALDMRVSYARWINIQLKSTVVPDDSGGGMIIAAVTAPSDIYIDSCIFKGVGSGTGGNIGVRVNDADAVVTFSNCIFYDFVSTDNPDDNGFRGLWVDDRSSVDIYNCLARNCYFGIGGNLTHTAINCVAFDNVDDFKNALGTIDYCASDQGAGEGTNGVDISGTWDTTCFTDETTDDYSVQDVDSPLYQTGNGATPKGTFTDDIIGTTRDAVDLNWDIGPFEWTAAGQVILIN